MENSDNRLRELRKKKGYTQQGLADLVGTSKDNISKLERGQRDLKQSWLKRLAPHLDVEPEEIIAASDKYDAPAKSASYGQLEERQRKTSRDAIETIADATHRAFLIADRDYKEYEVAAVIRAVSDATRISESAGHKITDDLLKHCIHHQLEKNTSG